MYTTTLFLAFVAFPFGAFSRLRRAAAASRGRGSGRGHGSGSGSGGGSGGRCGGGSGGHPSKGPSRYAWLGAEP